jgi:hypothetical protein
LLYTQPNPDWIPGGLGAGGWATSFPGGRGAWENYFTEAKTTDWFAFRDPEARWQRPYVSEKADEWREFQRLVSTAAHQRSHRAIDPDWASTVLTGHLGALALHDYGMFMALAAPIRDCLVDTLRAAVVTSSLDFLDSAQMIQAEKVYLAQVCDAASAEIAPAKIRWFDDPAWAGARAVVQEVWGPTYDHIEVLFAIHVIHEPLFGRLVRESFFTEMAPRHGDMFTPRVLSYTSRSAQAAHRWSNELFGRTLGGDPKFAAYNRTLMHFWADKWLPKTLAAVADAAALWRSTGRLAGSDETAGAYNTAWETIVGDWQESFGTLFDKPIHIAGAGDLP